jgi:hypothetical protein
MGTSFLLGIRVYRQLSQPGTTFGNPPMEFLSSYKTRRIKQH